MGLWTAGSPSGPPRAVCGWARCGWAPASSSPGSVYASVAGPRAPASIPESCPEKAATAGQPDQLRVHDSLDQRLHGPAAPERLPRLVSPRGCWEGPRLHPAPRLLTHGRPGRAQADGRVAIARAPGQSGRKAPSARAPVRMLGLWLWFFVFCFQLEDNCFTMLVSVVQPLSVESIHLSPPS